MRRRQRSRGLNRRRLAAGLCAAALVSGCSEATEGAGSPAGPPVASLTAAGTDAVAAGTARSLSPDGAKVEFRGDRGLCVADVDGSHQVCLSDDAKVSPSRAVAWSPDGSALVFTDSYFVELREPDIWIMDTATGAVRDLTDDGVDAAQIGRSDPAADLDLFPQFSADGASILFARQSGSPKDQIDFMSMPADGGTPKSIASISGSIQQLGGVAFSPDGSLIAATTYTDDFRHGAVSLLSVGGDRASVDGLPEGDRSLLSFSSDGKYLLVDSAVPYGQLAAQKIDNAAVVRVDGRAVTPVAGDVSTVMWPAWSPLGHGLAFVSGRVGERQLRVAAEPGGRSHAVLDGKDQLAAGGSRLSWSHTGAVLVYVDGHPTAVRLGS